MTSVSRLKSSSRLITKFKPTVPTKLKGGKLERLGNYLFNIFNDYRVVFNETLQDIKNRPVKASFYGSLLTTSIIMLKTNPSEQNFKSEIVECSNSLSSVGELIRNPQSDNHVTTLMTAMKDNTLKVRNLKFFTLVSMREFPVHSGLFEANCTYARPHWTEWYKSVVDVGIFGRWVFLHKAMKDYDVNPDEWLPDGQPKIKTKMLPYD
ncbi:mitochondrial import inner membrane translocase subunit Tim29-like [Mytilus californianus]|uniref:mitochondrial import inner membrane translocase subunit Tim29-like n=1 Tax=Mytilus californianus TaxID=6549 RepID=UPI0022467E73|nr:mitochondrial import inner membrane translocase subunit Tim29-like [Mytilus californianus]